jgi:tetratricopeptide (TPR) repeat protein
LRTFEPSGVCHWYHGASGKFSNGRKLSFEDYRIGLIRQGVLRLDPRNAKEFYDWAAARYAKGEFDPAIADLSEAIRLDPTLVRAFFKRGTVQPEANMKRSRTPPRP